MVNICNNCDHPLARDSKSKYCSSSCRKENESWIKSKQLIEKERVKNLIEVDKFIKCTECNKLFNEGKKHWCYNHWTAEGHILDEKSACHGCWDKNLADAVAKSGF